MLIDETVFVASSISADNYAKCRDHQRSTASRNNDVLQRVQVNRDV